MKTNRFLYILYCIICFSIYTFFFILTLFPLSQWLKPCMNRLQSFSKSFKSDFGSSYQMCTHLSFWTTPHKLFFHFTQKIITSFATIQTKIIIMFWQKWILRQLKKFPSSVMLYHACIHAIDILFSIRMRFAKEISSNVFIARLNTTFKLITRSRTKVLIFSENCPLFAAIQKPTQKHKQIFCQHQHYPDFKIFWPDPMDFICTT